MIVSIFRSNHTDFTHTSRPAVRYILLAEPRQARMPLPSGLGENDWFSEHEKKKKYPSKIPIPFSNSGSQKRQNQMIALRSKNEEALFYTSLL
ncbi:hypothetical protein [Flavobacterium sp. RSSB_23]|uniref:hypothetical protein n=1 Tax=Flavobacterium sp. RSSB_23 TaxID=3447668 RepID=UPI003F3C0840